MSDQAEKVAQFKAITGADDERAKFFLSSAADQLEVAIARYYENIEGTEDEDDPVEIVPNTTKESETAPSSLPASKPKPRSSNFATINTLRTSSDEEEGQAYYAGGSEHSGQQVLGPPKKKDIVADMFKSVQEHGVEILDPSSKPTTSKVFKGTGYKLGQDNNDTEVIPAEEAPPSPTEVTLRLWQNGFSINDGELRSYTDPVNNEFLNSIRRGEIPQELRQRNTEVHLAMEDHRMEMYKAGPKSRNVKAFQGQGYTLGSPAPAVVNAPPNEDKCANEELAKQMLQLNSSRPTTNLQIRLADGSRLVGQFNQDHTIETVRTYIETARPQYQNQSFNLLSSYPPKILKDSETLVEAGVLNATILQKLV